MLALLSRLDRTRASSRGWPASRPSPTRRRRCCRCSRRPASAPSTCRRAAAPIPAALWRLRASCCGAATSTSSTPTRSGPSLARCFWGRVMLALAAPLVVRTVHNVDEFYVSPRYAAAAAGLGARARQDRGDLGRRRRLPARRRPRCRPRRSCGSTTASTRRRTARHAAALAPPRRRSAASARPSAWWRGWLRRRATACCFDALPAIRAAVPDVHARLSATRS